MYSSQRDIPLKLQRKNPILDYKYRYQLFTPITVQLLTFAHGIAIGWISPTLLKLQSLDSPTNFTLTVEQVSWIGSLFGLGSLTGNIIFGFLINRIGRRKCMYLIAIPYMSAWISIFFSKSCLYLYLARFLGGMTGGGNYVVVPIYISEIADPSIRGFLSSMVMLFLSFGTMVGFILSSHVHYFVNPCIIIIIPIVYLMAATQLPETPQHLQRKQQNEEAYKALRFYNNLASHQHIEANAVKLEDKEIFINLKAKVLNINEKLEKLGVKDFVNAKALKAFFTAFVLMALNQFSGSFAFLNYMSNIFALTGTDIHPNTCTIIMGAAQILGICFAMTLVDRFGRKILMLVSSGGMALGLFSFGLYIQFSSADMKLTYNWLPLIIMTFIILIASVGVTSLLFTIIVEILPAKVRAPAASMCMAIMSSMVFIVLKLFPLLIQIYGLATVFYLCGGVCVVCWFYLLVFLKETKGLSLDQ